MPGCAKCNGQAGKPTYIAFRGKVYNLSESFMWDGGTHMAEHQDGKDLTDEFEDAPHERSGLERYAQVGVLQTERLKTKREVRK